MLLLHSVELIHELGELMGDRGRGGQQDREVFQASLRLCKISLFDLFGECFCLFGKKRACVENLQKYWFIVFGDVHDHGFRFIGMVDLFSEKFHHEGGVFGINNLHTTKSVSRGESGEMKSLSDGFSRGDTEDDEKIVIMNLFVSHQADV